MAEKLQYRLEVSQRATGTGLRDTREDIMRLKDQVGSLTEKARVQEIATYNLDKALRQTTATTTQARVGQAQLDAQRALARQTIRQLAADEQRLAATSNAAAGAKRNLGGAALEASRAFEDAQYGIRGVLNNIPGLLMMLGAGPGLAGVVSVGAVALSIFAKDLEKAKQEAKEAGNAGEEMNQKLADLFKTVEENRIDELVDDLERLREQQQQLGDSTLSQLELDKFRAESLAKVNEALREAAELEIQLAQARGQITPEDARLQIAALQAETEAASRQAEIALLDQRVASGQAKYQQQLDLIAQLREDEAALERDLAESQRRSAELNREAQGLRDIRTRNDGRLSGDQQRRLTALESEVSGIDEGIARLIESIESTIASRKDENARAFELANELDQALQQRDIGRETIEQIADISEKGAQNALTIAAEEARQALAAAAEDAVGRGQQLGEDARAALGELEAVLADGMVQANELERLQSVIERLTTTREAADQRVISGMETLEQAAATFLAKISTVERRINAQQRQIEALNNNVR